MPPDQQEHPQPDSVPPIQDEPSLHNVEKREQVVPPIRDVPELRNHVLGGASPGRSGHRGR